MTTPILRFSLLGAMAISLVYAQSDSGRITGTVTDSANSVVPHAGVTVTNEKTGRPEKRWRMTKASIWLPS
jgi:hypothetical protein